MRNRGPGSDIAEQPYNQPKVHKKPTQVAGPKKIPEISFFYTRVFYT